MKNVLLLIMVTFLFACNKKEEIAKEDSAVRKPYVISEFNKFLKAKDKYITDSNGRKIPIPPPPPIPGWLVYGTNTFIIDKDSKIYYFQREKIGFICGTGWENDTSSFY